MRYQFNPSESVEEFIEEVYPLIGARNKTVLGRAGLFLALGRGVPPEFKPTGSKGKGILAGEYVTGEELNKLVRAALNYRMKRTLDEAGYWKAFRRYFEYGCLQLKQIWEDSGKDETKFIAELLKYCNTDDFGERIKGQAVSGQASPVVSEPVNLNLFADGESWTMNEAGGNSLLVISGKPGTGKSQLALDLLAQVARQGVRFVFFDLKGELEDDPQNSSQRANRDEFLKWTGAKYVRLIQESLPINPLLCDENPGQKVPIAYGIAELIRCYAPQLGVKQEKAIAEAFQALSTPDFAGLADELEGMDAQGVGAALIHKIVRFNLFASAQNAVHPDEWLQSSLVIDFKEFGNDTVTKSLAVALILNFLMKRMNQSLPVENGVQPLKCVLFVDEAHLLLPKEGKSGLLGSLARQGRSWGFPVWLASQDADAFFTTGANATNFADLAGRGLHFSPETLNSSAQRKILGELPSRMPEKGEAVLRSPNERLAIGAVRQFWRDKGK